MIEDFREHGEKSEIKTQICIVGAGAAGITIAREFLNSHVDVVLLESGSAALEEPVQDLYQAANRGLPRRDHRTTRLRYFGGTTNHWTGLCAPFPADEITQRPWVENSGWPLTREELESFYSRSASVCQIDYTLFDSRLWKQLDKKPPVISEKLLKQMFLHYSPPVRFGAEYGDQLKQSSNVRVLFHSNAVNFQATASGQAVKYLDIKTLEGKSSRVFADVFVLCCGAIENARLLLASNTVDPRGLGNQRDVVGRYFLDHIFCSAAEVVELSSTELSKIYSDFEYRNRRYRPGFRLSYEMLRKHKVTSTSLHLWAHTDPTSRSYRAARRLIEGIGEGQMPSSDLMSEAASDFPSLFSDLSQKLFSASSSGSRWLEVVAVVEPTPIASSRVQLDDSVDTVGLRRAKVDWQIKKTDWDSLRIGLSTLGREFGRLGLGRLRMKDWVSTEEPEWGIEAKDYNHHSGTTRMAESSEFGVVDKNAKVHGIDNLYIAGSSVFPTVGSVNPTFTIVALALRLADSTEIESLKCMSR